MHVWSTATSLQIRGTRQREPTGRGAVRLVAGDRQLPMAAEPFDEDGRRIFHIRVRKLSGSAGRFIDLAATPMKLTRSGGHRSADGLTMIGITLMQGADVFHEFGSADRSALVRQGQILVKDFTEPATALWQASPHRGLNLHVPRSTMEAAVGDRVGGLHGTALPSEGLVPLLGTQLRTLAEIAPRLRSAAGTAALKATIELAASVLRCELGVRVEDEVNTAGMFAAAQVFIRRHLTWSKLGPELIARQIGGSRADLYRVFAAHGETVAGFVRELRLQRARGVLAHDASSGVRVSDVAYRCGFDDPVHFTRLFRERFGLTPSALRTSELRRRA